MLVSSAKHTKLIKVEKLEEWQTGLENFKNTLSEIEFQDNLNMLFVHHLQETR